MVEAVPSLTTIPFSAPTKAAHAGVENINMAPIASGIIRPEPGLRSSLANAAEPVRSPDRPASTDASPTLERLDASSDATTSWPRALFQTLR
ncbi:hypothetical protein X976_5359 [Burkholderia pseudomallei MSHR7500]|nr:hypothetical protein X976_5359 [Burkholderia pseudomallei MSHR7500]